MRSLVTIVFWLMNSTSVLRISFVPGVSFSVALFTSNSSSPGIFTCVPSIFALPTAVGGLGAGGGGAGAAGTGAGGGGAGGGGGGGGGGGAGVVAATFAWAAQPFTAPARPSV